MDHIAFNFINFDSNHISKNQTRPIVNLAKLTNLVKSYIKEFRPSGASEIRKAHTNLTEWQKE